MFNPSKIKRTNLSISMKTPISDCVSQGEIAPYYMGTPEFVIPDQVIENELAAPNYLK